MPSEQPRPETSPQPEMRVFEPGQHVMQSKPNSEHDEQRMAAWVEGRRNQILEQFPPNIEGLNIDRVRNFITGLGLPVGAFTLVDSDQTTALEAELSKMGIVAEGEADGSASAVLALAYVTRSPELEANNGVGITEATLVHELGHLTGSIYMAAASEGEGSLVMTPRRMGYGVKEGTGYTNEYDMRGYFFEEGFAGHIKQRYITEVLGLPQGFGPDVPVGQTYTRTNEDGQVRMQMPAYYLSKDEAGEYTFFVASQATAGLELLIEQDPDIGSLLYKARTSVEAKRQLAQAIDQVSPGLYDYLGRLQYTQADFFKGYQHIQELIKGKAS